MRQDWFRSEMSWCASLGDEMDLPWQQSCPSADNWRRLLAGVAPDGSGQTFWEHLSNCCQCQRLVAELEAPPIYTFGRPAPPNGTFAT